MRMRSVVANWMVAVALMALAGCSVKVDPPQIKVSAPGGQLGAGVTTCTVTTLGGATVDSGSPVTLQVDIGTSNYNVLITPPFKLDGEGSYESQTFTFSKTFTNDTAADKTVTGELEITDSKGGSLTCEYTVKVRKVQSSTLACDLQVTPASPKAGESFIAIATASNGTSPYTFSGLSLGAGGTIVSDISSVSSTAVVATGKYTTTGTKVVSLQLKDGANATVNCTRQLTVASAPVVTLSVSPSSSVAAGTSILVTAATSGFTGTPTFVWSTTTSGVAIQSLGNSALVSSQDGKARTLTLNVTATSGSQVATATQSLAFTSSTTTTLTCTVRVTDGWWDWDDYFGWYFVANVAAVPTNASGGAYLTNVTVPLGSVVTDIVGLEAQVVTQPSGSFNVSGDIADGAGRTAHCTAVTIDPDLYWDWYYY